MMRTIKKQDLDRFTFDSIETVKDLYFTYLRKNRDSLGKLMIYFTDLFFSIPYIGIKSEEIEKMITKYSDFLKDEKEIIEKNILKVFSLFKMNLNILKEEADSTYFSDNAHFDQYLLVIISDIELKINGICIGMEKEYGLRVSKILRFIDSNFSEDNKTIISFREKSDKAGILKFNRFIAEINEMKKVVHKFIDSLHSDFWSAFNYIFNSNEKYSLPFLIRKHLKNKK